VLAQLKYIVILPFLVLVYWAISWGLADIFSYRVLHVESEWQARGEVPSINQWNTARASIENAMSLNTFSPDYPGIMARLYVWRLYVDDAPIGSFEEYQAFLAEGLAYMRSSIEKRPTWPSGWASLLEMKSLGGILDGEYWLAWDSTVALGPWDRASQVKLLTSGLVYWENFDEEQKGKVIDVFISMLAKSTTGSEAILIANEQGALPLFCNVVPKESITALFKKNCVKLEETTGVEPLPVNDTAPNNEPLPLAKP